MASRPTAPRGPSIVNVLPEPTPTVTSSGSATRSVRDTSLLTYSLPCPSPSGRRQARPRSRRARRTRRAARREGGAAGHRRTHTRSGPRQRDTAPMTTTGGAGDGARASIVARHHHRGPPSPTDLAVSQRNTPSYRSKKRSGETKRNRKRQEHRMSQRRARLLHLDEHDITLHYIINYVTLHYTLHCIVVYCIT